MVERGAEINNDKYTFLELSVQDSIDYLRRWSIPAAQNELVEIAIQDAWTLSSAKELTSLKFEIGLTEMQGRCILTTSGSPTSILSSYFIVLSNTGRATDKLKAYLSRSDRSRLNAHTHVRDPEKGTVITPTVSLADFLTTQRISNTTPLLLLEETKILRYQRPIRDLDGNVEGNKSPDRILMAWERRNNYRFYVMRRKPGYPNIVNFRDLPDEERFRLLDELLETTGAIAESAPWEDEERAQKLLRYLNLEV